MKFSAGEVINRRCAERDSEMTDKANRRRGPSHIARMRSKDTSSDTLQDAKRSGSHQAESDKRLSKIQYACQQTAPEDRWQRTLGLHRCQQNCCSGVCVKRRIRREMADALQFIDRNGIADRGYRC